MLYNSYFTTNSFIWPSRTMPTISCSGYNHGPFSCLTPSLSFHITLVRLKHDPFTFSHCGVSREKELQVG